MRDLLLLAMVGGTLLMALRRPWLAILLWVWISLMNPHRYTYGFAYDAPLAAAAAVSVLLGLLISKERDSPFKGPPVSFFVALTMWITLSWLLGVDVAGDYPQWDKVMKINLMVFLSLVLLRTKEHIIVMTWVMTLSIALLGAKGGLFTIVNGGNYRVWGPTGSFVEGNNEFAVAVIMAIPLLRFMQLQVTSKLLSNLLLVAMLLCATSALGSHSRGALLAVVAMAAVLWWRSQNRLRGGIFLVLIGATLIGLMPAVWSERMDTMESYDQDRSALGRFSAWWVSWRLALSHPFGIGFNITRPEFFAAYSPYPELGTPVAHSIFFQMLGNHGFVGLFLFLAVWVTTWRMASKIRLQARNIPQAKWCGDLANMCQVSMVGFLVGGAFLQMAYYDFAYYVMVLVCLVKVWMERKAWLTEPAAVGRWRSLIGIGPSTAAGQPVVAGVRGRPGSVARP